MSLPKYREYKDSGVEWLGHIPMHWSVDRIKASIAFARNGIWGNEPQGDETDIACIRVADFDRAKLDIRPHVLTIRSVTEKERVGRVLRRGDLLLEKSGGGELQPVGQVVLYQLDGTAVCSNFVARVVLKPGMYAPYWNYVHNAAYSAGVNIGSINQTSGIQNLDQDRYFNERAPFPPEAEQAAIATFLDRETARIDALIAEQKKLIAVLAEKRQATISHAVTKGLNPSASMKDSGVAWLEEVPAHWACVQLGRLCTRISDGPHFSPSYVDEGVMFLSARNIRVDGWSLGDVKYVSEADYKEFCRRMVPEVGDILYTKGGTTGIARVVDLKERFQVWVHVAVLKLKKAMALPHYVAYALNSLGCYEQSQLFTRGATNQDLGLTRMTKILLALPPMREQAEVVRFLDSETAKLDALTTKSQEVINLLEERRSALIAAAVTGQIDVRDVVSHAAAASWEAIAA